MRLPARYFRRGETDRSLEQEFGEAASSASGAIQILLGIAGKIRFMAHSAVTLGEETLARIEPLTKVTTELSDRVDRLSHQMNLVALNAQIQAVRIVAGTGLEVLAAHTATVATEAARLGESIREGLERFQDTLLAEAGALAEGNSQGREQQAHLNGAVCAREQRLQSVGEAIEWRMQQMRADVARCGTPFEVPCTTGLILFVQPQYTSACAVRHAFLLVERWQYSGPPRFTDCATNPCKSRQAGA